MTIREYLLLTHHGDDFDVDKAIVEISNEMNSNFGKISTILMHEASKELLDRMLNKEMEFYCR